MLYALYAMAFVFVTIAKETQDLSVLTCGVICFGLSVWKYREEEQHGQEKHFN